MTKEKVLVIEKMRLDVRAFLVIGLLLEGSLFANDTSLSSSHKIAVRTSAAQIRNSQTGGSLTSIGAFNLVFDYFVVPHFSINLGYTTFFDNTNATLALQGPSLGAKYFFWRSGSWEHSDHNYVSYSKRDRWGLYALLGLYSYSYNLISKDDPNLNERGQATTIDAGLGSVYSLSRAWDLNAEFTYSVTGFSSNPDNVKLSLMTVNLGAAYVF